MRIDPLKHYCYLPGPLVQVVIDDPKMLDGLIELLEIPGKPAHLRSLSTAEKKAAVEQQVNHLAKLKTSLWYGVDHAEIVAAHLLKVGDRKGTPVFFSPVKKEADLLTPIAAWLGAQGGLDVFKEVPMGTKRVDLLGYRKGGFFRSDSAVAVELKNDIEQLKRGLDQMSTFSEYAHRVYLACTPLMAAQYLQKHAEARTVRHWDPDVLNNKLRKVGIGLLLVRDKDIEEVIPPRDSTPNDRKFKELLAELTGRYNAVR
jgi:hypothetical protein